MLRNSKALENEVRNTFGSNCTIQTGAAGTSLALTIPYARTGLELKKEARMHRNVDLLILEENADYDHAFCSPVLPLRQTILPLPVSFCPDFLINNHKTPVRHFIIQAGVSI